MLNFMVVGVCIPIMVLGSVLPFFVGTWYSYLYLGSVTLTNVAVILRYYR